MSLSHFEDDPFQGDKQVKPNSEEHLGQITLIVFKPERETETLQIGHVFVLLKVKFKLSFSLI